MEKVRCEEGRYGGHRCVGRGGSGTMCGLVVGWWVLGGYKVGMGCAGWAG
jgi:hypothetical protein